MADDMRIRMLDVGQGDAIVGLLPGGQRAFVVDVYRAEPVLSLLEAEGIREIFLYLSHSDRDHSDGAIDLLTGFEGVFHGIFFNHDRWAPSPKSAFALLCRTIGEISRAVERTSDRSSRQPLTTNLNTDQAYLAWFGRSVRIVVLHPAPSDLDVLVTQGKNEISGVLLVEHDTQHGTRRSLLTADVQLTGISLMLGRIYRRPIGADVLKFPHHGAWPEAHPGLSFIPDATPHTMADFLTAVAPRVVLVSAGLSNPHGHVKPAVFDALHRYHASSGSLTRILCTQFTGACLHHRVVNLDAATPHCAGDIEIRTGDMVENNGLSVSAVRGGEAHLRRIQEIISAGGTPRCQLQPPVADRTTKSAGKAPSRKADRSRRK